jgi:hypothetical protein
MTAPSSVTDLRIAYTEDFSCSAFETEYGDWIGLNYTDPQAFLDDVHKILQVLYYDGWELTLHDVVSRRAISVENSEGDLHLWWGGVKTHTPHSFDIYLILT